MSRGRYAFVADGSVPVHCRRADCNNCDSVTHIEAWSDLPTVAGCADSHCAFGSTLYWRSNHNEINHAS